jgi:hypothetical protein
MSNPTHESPNIPNAQSSADLLKKFRLQEIVEYAKSFPEIAAVINPSTKPVSNETVVLHLNEAKTVDVTVLTSRIKNPA